MMGLFGIPDSAGQPKKKTSSSSNIDRVNSLMFNSSDKTPTWQHKLNNYANDRASAQKEVIRAKSVYEKEQANGASSDKLRQIRHWADQVRDAAGLDGSKYGSEVNYNQAKSNYQSSLNPKPQQPQQQQQQVQQYQAPSFNAGKYRTQLASISDLQKKYGFDYSREYAQRQAEAERQAKQDGLNETKKRVENNVRGSVDSLDRNYFQQYMNQAQSQTNNGLNAGIASDQNLRLAMNRQAEMGDIYRDANANQFQLDNALGRLDAEALVREDSLFNDRLQQGFENILDEGQFRQRDNLSFLQAELQARGQDNQSSQYWNSFNNLSASQQANNELQTRQLNDIMGRYWNDFNNISSSQLANLGLQNQQQELNALNVISQLTGYMPNGQSTLAREDQEFRNGLALQQFNRPYDQLTAQQQAQLSLSYYMQQQDNNYRYDALAQDNAQFGETMASSYQKMIADLMGLGVTASEIDEIFGAGTSSSASSGGITGNQVLDYFLQNSPK